MEIIRRRLGAVGRLSHVKQVAIDVVLHDEAGRVEPVWSANAPKYQLKVPYQ